MATQPVAQLSSYFTNIINSVMLVEREPLDRLTQSRDTINVQRGVYSDLQSKLSELQLTARSLQSSDPLFSLSLARKVSVTNQPSDHTVVSASASSTAATGSYEISVTHLALAQRKVSAAQSSTDQALGFTGTIQLGGNGTKAASTAGSDIVTGVGTSAVGTDLKELGTGTYTVETRLNGTQYEFRVKDVDGNLMSVADKSSASGTLTTDWQKVEAGSFDTKRGLTIAFAASGSAKTTSVSYTAAGTSVTINATDSLLRIAANINSALQPEGREIQATVVGKQLMFNAVHTGTAHTMIFTDNTSAGLGFGADMQTARNAEFTVSGMSFERSANTGLTDVIAGVTLNLANDSEGHSATLSVAGDASPARKSIEGFLSQLNNLQTYISEKTSITESGEGSNKTYTRGALSDESSVSELRMTLYGQVMNNVASSSSFKSLREIGLGVTDDLKVGVTDSDKLEDALQNHYDDVKLLLDGYMQDVNSTLGRFTGSNGYLTSAIAGLDRETRYQNDEIANMETNLQEKQLYLINQYAQMQQQLIELQSLQQMMSSMYGGGINLGA